MNDTAENKKMVHQGRNVKIVRESKGMYQKDLGEKINKLQSEISRIESQDIIDNDLLETIALALEIPVDFLKNFDLDTAAKAYNMDNDATLNGAENSHDTVNQVAEQDNIINNYPIEDFKELTEKMMNKQHEQTEWMLNMQRELLEEKHELDKQIALLKQELEVLKNKK